MTDEDKVKAVVTSLVGEFYLGQEVEVCVTGWLGKRGVVKELDKRMPLHVGVDLGEYSDGETMFFHKEMLKLL